MYLGKRELQYLREFQGQTDWCVECEAGEW